MIASSLSKSWSSRKSVISSTSSYDFLAPQERFSEPTAPKNYFDLPAKVKQNIKTVQADKMVRKLKHHEQKLLRKVDFTTYAGDNNHRDAAVIRRYNIQKPSDYQKYNRLCGVSTISLCLSSCHQ
jgi:hypothetical protein